MQHTIEPKKKLRDVTIRSLLHVSVLAVIVLGVIAWHAVSATSISAVPPASPITPAPLLNISATAQAKSGWLGLGVPDASTTPFSVVDVRGTFISDVLGILGTTWITEKVQIGGTTPSVSTGDPSLMVNGSRIKSLVLTGSGERGICSDVSGRLIICGAPAAVPAACGYAAAYSLGGSGFVNPETDPEFLTRTANPYLCNTGVPVLPVTITGGNYDSGRAAWNRMYGRWSCAGTSGGPSVDCWTEGVCPVASGVGCFLPGTMITLADGSKKAIETMTTDDIVLTTRNQTNKVKKTIEHRYVGWVYGINGSKPFVTANHPMMTPDGWKSFDPELSKITEPELIIVDKLQVGDFLIKEDGSYEKIVSTNREWMDTIVHNLVVSGNHEYFADTYQVHNTTLSGASCIPLPGAPDLSPISPPETLTSLCTGTLTSPACNVSAVSGATSAVPYTYPVPPGTFGRPYDTAMTGYGCFVTYSTTAGSPGVPITRYFDCMDTYRVE